MLSTLHGIPTSLPRRRRPIGETGMTPRTFCAAIAACCGAVVVMLRSGQGSTGMAQDTTDLGLVALGSAIAGAIVLPFFVAPRAKGRLKPLVGGIVVAPMAMLMILLPDIIQRSMEPNAVIGDTILWALLGLIYAVVIAAPVFMIGATVVNEILRRRYRE